MNVVFTCIFERMTEDLKSGQCEVQVLALLVGYFFVVSDLQESRFAAGGYLNNLNKTLALSAKENAAYLGMSH